MAKFEDVETRPRGCKYPTTPCALARILPETNVRAEFVKSRTLRPLISYFFNCNNKYSLSLYVYPRGMLGCLLGFWPLVQNHAGATTSKVCSFALHDGLLVQQLLSRPPNLRHIFTSGEDSCALAQVRVV